MCGQWVSHSDPLAGGHPAVATTRNALRSHGLGCAPAAGAAMPPRKALPSTWPRNRGPGNSGHPCQGLQGHSPWHEVRSYQIPFALC